MQKRRIYRLIIIMMVVIALMAVVFLWALNGVNAAKQAAVNNLGSRIDTFIDYYEQPNYAQTSANYIVYSYKALYCNPKMRLSANQSKYLNAQAQRLLAVSQRYPAFKIFNGLAVSKRPPTDFPHLCFEHFHTPNTIQPKGGDR